MTVQKHELDVKSFTLTGGIVGIISGILGVLIHGGIGMPSMMGYMFGGFMWANPMHASGAVIASLINFKTL